MGHAMLLVLFKVLILVLKSNMAKKLIKYLKFQYNNSCLAIISKKDVTAVKAFSMEFGLKEQVSLMNHVLHINPVTSKTKTNATSISTAKLLQE